MCKWISWCLAMTTLLLMPPSALHAEEAAPTGHVQAAGEARVPEYHLVPGDWSELKLSLFNIAWVMVIFLVLLAVLYPTAWKNVLAGLEAREKRIRTDVMEAEKATAKAKATLDQYNQAIAAAEARSRETIAAAASQAEKMATQHRMQAQQQSEATKESALKEIEASRADATTQIREEIGTLATMIATKVIRRDLHPGDQHDLVRETLAN